MMDGIFSLTVHGHESILDLNISVWPKLTLQLGLKPFGVQYEMEFPEDAPMKPPGEFMQPLWGLS